MGNSLSTEVFVTECLPAMAAAAPEDAITAYRAYNAEVDAVMGDVVAPGISSFDWGLLGEITADVNQDQGEVAARTTAAVHETAIEGIVYRRGVGVLTAIPVHTGPGTYLTIDSEGHPRAFGHELNPAVPLEYGCIDGAALRKIGQAVFIEKLCRIGADWGAGYTVLQAINKRFNIVGPTGRQTIGMATLHGIPYAPEIAGTDRNVLAFSGTAGRTASQLLLQYLRIQPAFASRLPADQGHPDTLAGLLDSLSSTVANRAAIQGVNERTHIVDLPNPLSRDNVAVNWN